MDIDFSSLIEAVDSLSNDIENEREEETTEERNQLSFVRQRIYREGDMGKLWNFFKDNNIENDVFICGGYVRWMCSPCKNPKEANDIDIYCRDRVTYENLRSHLSNHSMVVKHSNEVSITYHQSNRFDSQLFGLSPLQIITPLREGAVVTDGEIDEILRNFDFTVVRAGIDCEMWEEKEALVDIDFSRDESNGRLVFKNIHCPISSTFRCMKYIKRGYKIKTGEVLKLFIDWQDRPKEYKENIINFFERFSNVDISGRPSSAEIDTMYRILRID